MDVFNLEVAQMLKDHPVLGEKVSYKHKYINVLEYFVRKYSPEDSWANAVLKLYKEKILDNPQDYTYGEFDLFKQSKPVIATKFKPFRFFSYRYCLIIDCVFINAIKDQAKGEQIYSELSSIYHKRYEKRIRQVFDGLYNADISLDGFEQITYMVECWRKNIKFLSEDPIKVLVTANMSAGKSTLLNALIGKKVNKTQNDACTAKIHYIVNKPFEDGFYYEVDHLLNLDADYKTLMEDNQENVSSEIIVGAFFRTVGKEPKRVWFVDTPGVNSSQDVGHRELTEKTIANTDADLLIYLLNSENIGTEDDRKHLLFILENYHGKILFVVNKLDRFRKKEDSVSETLDAVVRDLGDMGFENPEVVPVSSYAAYLAKLSIFGESLDEDEQDELDRMSRKMRKPEYQFNTYFSDDIQSSIQLTNDDENYQLLMHSGVLQLENIIHTLRR